MNNYVQYTFIKKYSRICKQEITSYMSQLKSFKFEKYQLDVIS